MTENHAANAMDAGAVLIWIMSIANLLPSIAAGLSIIWLILRILESRTVQQALGQWRWINKEIKNNDGDEV